MTDKITINIDGDTTALERKLTELQKKINSFRTGGAMNNLGNVPGAGADVNERMRQSKAEIFKRTQNQIDSELSKQLGKYSQIASQLDSQVASAEKLLKLRNAEAATLANISRLKSQQTQMSMAGGGGPPGGGGGGVGGGGGGGGGGIVGNIMNKVGGAIAGLGTVGAGMTAYGGIQGFRAQIPFKQMGRQTSVAKSSNQIGQRAIDGQSDEDLIFAPERAKAIDSSMDFFTKAQDAREYRATGKAIGGTLGVGAGIWGGAKLGAMGGAAIGTAIAGPLGTAAGGFIGGVGGAIAGGLGMASATFGSDEETYYGLTRNKKALSEMTAKEAMDNQETAYQKNQTADMGKYFQKKFMIKNKDRMTDLQRSAGLTDDQMFGEGGFVTGSGADQFKFEQRAGMQAQMVQAGGSGQWKAGSGTTGGGLNTMALQAQRSMGLTNAGQAMGRVTSYLSQEESKDAFIKVLAQGVSVGLDDSDFREEQKDYFNQVTSLAQNLGGGTEMISAGLAAGMEGDISRRGVQFSADAFKAVGDITSDTKGITAAARASIMSKNDDYKNIKGLDRVAFQNMKDDDIRTDSDQMKRFYKKSRGFVDEKGNAEEGDIKEANQKDFEKYVKTRKNENRESVLSGFKESKDGKRAWDLFQKGKKETLGKYEQAEFGGLFKELTGQSINEKRATAQGKVFTGQARAQEEAESATKDYQNMKDQGMFLGPKGRASIGDFSGQGVFGDIFNDKGAKLQNDVLKNKDGSSLSKTADEVITNLASNLDKTLSSRLTMALFNEKLGIGATAVQNFITSLGALSDEKIKSIKKGSSGKDQNRTQPVVTGKTGTGPQGY